MLDQCVLLCTEGGGLPFLVELTPEGGDSRVVRLQMSVTGTARNPLRGLYFVTLKIYILPLTSFRRYADIDSPNSFFVYLSFRFAHILPFYFPFSF
jgi:hypothetical protein